MNTAVAEKIRQVKVQSENKGNSPKLLDQVRQVIRTKHYSYRTEKLYVGWIRQYIMFHWKKYPNEMGESEINQFIIWEAKVAKYRRTTLPKKNDPFSIKPVFIKIAYGEVELARKVKSVGGVWEKEKKLWKVPLQTVLDLNIEHRITTKR